MRIEQYAEQMPAAAALALLQGFPVGCGNTGQGRPLVLLHCSGSDRQHWSRCLGAWSAAGLPPRRFLMPELFGCGGTAPWPFDGHPSLQDYAALVGHALAHVDEPIDLVGHSFGGAVALQIARDRPETIASLTLIEPAAFFILRDQGERESRLLAEFEALGTVIRDAAAERDRTARRHAMRCFVEYWNGAGRWDAFTPALQDAMTDMLGVVAHDIAAALTEDSRLRDYAGLPMPVLLIGGQHSPAPVRHMNAMLAAALPVARATAIAGAGHMTPITHAPLLSHLIADHVDVSARRHRGSEMEL